MLHLAYSAARKWAGAGGAARDLYAALKARGGWSAAMQPLRDAADVWRAKNFEVMQYAFDAGIGAGTAAVGLHHRSEDGAGVTDCR